MSTYINGMGVISPQQSWNDEALLIHAFDYRGVTLPAVEPEYEEWFDPRQLRRMSRIIKMGLTAAFMAMKDAGIQNPGAIITGTAYGCLEDTGIFLKKLVENSEENLNPTPFIQSTHNTISSQIAMLLQCTSYNQTYTHSAFSFESALLDAAMHADEFPSKEVLVGAVDEITPLSHSILSRFHVFRSKLASTLNVFRQPKRGTINGEGAAFFVLSGTRRDDSVASIEGVKTFYKSSPRLIHDGIETLIREAGLTPAQIDLVLLGKSGDRSSDRDVEALCAGVFPKKPFAYFKHLCGEYPTASAFALWLAARIIDENNVPEVLTLKPSTRRPVRHVLVFNNWFGTHHSAILVSTCQSIL